MKAEEDYYESKARWFLDKYGLENAIWRVSNEINSSGYLGNFQERIWYNYYYRKILSKIQEIK